MVVYLFFDRLTMQLCHLTALYTWAETPRPGALGIPRHMSGQLAWGLCVLPDLINLIAPLTTENPRDAAQNEKKAPPIQPTTPGLLEIEK